MGLVCFIKGHDWVKTEEWTGNAYDTITVKVSNYACSRCSKVRKELFVGGKLSKPAAEKLVDSATGVVVPDTTDYIELTEIKEKPKSCKKVKA